MGYNKESSYRMLIHYVSTLKWKIREILNKQPDGEPSGIKIRNKQTKNDNKPILKTICRSDRGPDKN